MISLNAHNYTYHELQDIRNRQLADALRPIKAEAWDRLMRHTGTDHGVLQDVWKWYMLEAKRIVEELS